MRGGGCPWKSINGHPFSFLLTSRSHNFGTSHVGPFSLDFWPSSSQVAKHVFFGAFQASNLHFVQALKDFGIPSSFANSLYVLVEFSYTNLVVWSSFGVLSNTCTNTKDNPPLYLSDTT